MSALRVMQVVESFDLSGRSQVIADLCGALQPLGVESRIACLAREARFPNPPCPVSSLGRHQGMDWRVVVRLAAQVRQMQANVIHSHGRGALLYARLAAIFRTSLRHVHTVHRADGDPLKAPAWIQRRIIRHVSALVAVSVAARDAFLAPAVLSPSRVTVIPNGIDLSRFVPKSIRSCSPSGAPVLGTVSHLTADKDQATALRAFALLRSRFPAARLQVVGDGPEASRLRTLAQDLGISDGVDFLGLRSDVPELLSRFDVLVHAARTEGLGLAVLEAMACGVPVVATAVGGLPEIVQPGRTGWLVPAGDPLALSQTVVEVLTHPPHVQAIAREAARFVRDHFSRERMAADYRRLYNSVHSSHLGNRTEQEEKLL